MSPTRRQFVTTTAAAAGTMALGLSRASARTAHTARMGGSSDAALRVLILGGTGFIGPHMVTYAAERGHSVSVFTRGRSDADLPDGIEYLIGDRDTGDLRALKGRTWDAVIDNSAATEARWVRESCAQLRGSVGTYLFTSTRSVYASFDKIGMNEDSPLLPPDPAAIDEGRDLSYGIAKSTMEAEVRRVFDRRFLIVRPGLIVGPGDNTDRFTYWPARIDRGGEVLAPGDPDNYAMFIDVRDLSEWYIHLLERGTTGILNALGPASPLTFAEMLYGIRAVTTANVSFTWADTDFLLSRNVRPYSDMPLWIPARGDRVGFQRFDLTRPIAHGLTYRPLAETARDTLEYHYSRPADRQANMRAGMKPDREAQLLAEWKRR